MGHIIQTPGFKARKKLTDFVKQNTLKLSAFGDRIIECKVLLKMDSSDSKDNKICELRLAITGNDIFAEKRSSKFEDAVLRCVGAVEHQVKRWKDSLNNGKLRGSVTPLESEESSQM